MPSLLLCLFGMLICAPALAYIDPGSGSYLLQLILGSILGGVYWIKVHGGWLFSRKKQKNKQKK